MAADPKLLWRNTLIGLLLLCLCGFVPAPLPKRDRPNADLTRLQGVWELIALTHDGRPAPCPTEDAVISGNVMKRMAGGEETAEDWVISLYERRRPKALDLTRFRDGAPDFVLWGIYQLDGDTLTIYSRYGEYDDVRPTEYDGSKRGIRKLVYQRKKK